MEKSCQRCSQQFEAKRADKIYCSGACKQAAVRARRGVDVARKPPEPRQESIEQRLVAIEERQRDILTDLDDLERGLTKPYAGGDTVLARLDAIEARMKKMAKALEALSARQREHEVALTKVAELIAAEPWRRR